MASPCKSQSSSCSSSTLVEDDQIGLRRGPWTVDEDSLLIHAISVHGEGRWNLLAIRSGLRRTGKSCRLRWLNYLKPDVKRGNLSPQEQLLILDLHCRWGNRWSKIAQEIPGRTDNEIKNYWRTRVQKQAKLLNIDTNSPEFKDIINRFWIPRLIRQINEESSNSSPSSSSSLPLYSIPQLSDSDEKQHHFITSEIGQNVGSSNPFSDVVPSWNHGGGGGGDMGDFDCTIGDSGWQFTGWTEEEDSDGDGLWNFDGLWQF